MAVPRKNVAPVDGIAAYQIAIECLPRADMWDRAVRARTGAEPGVADRVFAVIGDLRKELQSRVGDLVYGPPDQQPSQAELTGPQDLRLARAALLAYELVLEHFPDEMLLSMALPCRRDGADPTGVLEVLDDWRRELRIRLGDISAIVDEISTGTPDVSLRFGAALAS